jgi:hypothetical protein
VIRGCPECGGHGLGVDFSFHHELFEVQHYIACCCHIFSFLMLHFTLGILVHRVREGKVDMVIVLSMTVHGCLIGQDWNLELSKCQATIVLEEIHLHCWDGCHSRSCGLPQYRPGGWLSTRHCLIDCPTLQSGCSHLAYSGRRWWTTWWWHWQRSWHHLGVHS